MSCHKVQYKSLVQFNTDFENVFEDNIMFYKFGCGIDSVTCIESVSELANTSETNSFELILLETPILTIPMYR